MTPSPRLTRKPSSSSSSSSWSTAHLRRYVGHDDHADGPDPGGEPLAQTDEEAGEGRRQVEAAGGPGAVRQAEGAGADHVDHGHQDHLAAVQVGQEQEAESGDAFTWCNEQMADLGLQTTVTGNSDGTPGPTDDRYSK